MLGEILSLEYGKPLSDADRKLEGKFPVYGANGIKSRSDKYYYDKPTVIVGRKGSAGEIIIVEEKFWPLDVTYFVTFDDSKYNLKFLFLLLKGLNLPSYATGVKPGINRNEIYSIKVEVPPLTEQKRIVKILDEKFGAIEELKKVTEQQIVDAKELFESRLSEVFSDSLTWSRICVGDLGATQTGNTPKTSEKSLYGNYIPFIKPADIDFDGRGSINFNGIGLSEIGYKLSRKIMSNSVLMVCIGATITKVGFSTQEVTTNQQINSVTPSDKFISKFIYYEMRTKRFRDDVIKKSSQATLPIINKSNWSDLEIVFPNLNEQKQIVKELDELSGKTKELEAIFRRKIADLDELKKSYLEQAFSGKL